MAVPLSKRRFTADEYQWMGRVGILTEEDRVELIDGEIVEMAPIGEEHNASVDWLTALFVRRFGDVAQIRVQGSVRLGPYNEPEPDLVLLRPRKDFYRRGMATGWRPWPFRTASQKSRATQLIGRSPPRPTPCRLSSRSSRSRPRRNA